MFYLFPPFKVIFVRCYFFLRGTERNRSSVKKKEDLFFLAFVNKILSKYDCILPTFRPVCVLTSVLLATLIFCVNINAIYF